MQRGVQANKTVLASLSSCYQLLLYAYPSQFRQEYGVGMAQVFRDEVRLLLHEGQTAVLLQFLLQSIFDLAKTAVIEQVEALFNLTLTGGPMSYHDTVQALSENPQELEQLYQDALKAGQQKAFEQAIDDAHKNAPGNLLLAGWFHRLHFAAQQAKRFIIEWPWVVPLGLLNGLLFWWLTDTNNDQLMMQVMGGPSAPRGARQGLNSYVEWFAGDAEMAGDYFGYDGPCPPWNDSIRHRYVFTLYAIDLASCPVDGRFTGQMDPPMCYGAGKIERTLRIAEAQGFCLDDATFYSDSITDLPLLERVQRPVIVNPDARLRRLARRRGWPIERW